ncbi:MAG: glycosyltransferase [Bacteroidetes bacterium]|nr:glycosyltransferase [Bacteroidota bacterium]
MKLSIVIVNYNVKYFLEQCLHSVLKACEGVAAEVFVVDNNSVDGSMEMVRHKFPTVIRIENKVNLGFSKANNQAIRECNGEYVLLLNPDTVVEEDTFRKIVEFMDMHPGAGGLGVKMLDGSGKFLPESKRGLPTPAAAFYKISGLASLFPKSKTFGHYHLGYLDKDETNEVEILAGAFMLLRKSVLDKTGLLDEDFFMYGEDIDLSYRILKAGYKNYYFPETRIIHYKGESTKKSSVNYVLVFYNAMIIFARKHYTKQNAALFIFIIRIAIYLRAGAALLSRFLQKSFLPLLDFALVFSGLFFLKEYWSRNMVVQYPQEFMLLAVPSYIIIWILSVYFSGGYDQPVKLQKIVRGLFSGTLLILVIYALLPEHYRFSRALILLGSVWAGLSMISMRLVLNLLGQKQFALESNSRKKLLIVGEEDEASRVLSLLKMSETTHNFIGFLRPQEKNTTNAKAEFEKFNLGSTDKFREVIEVYGIEEIIFCARDIASNKIINFMSEVTSREVEYKIAPPESMFIIGSNSMDNAGELYVIDINSISKWMNKRNKRLLDIILCILFIIACPLLVFFQKKPIGFFSNIFKVLFGKYSWVGYAGGKNIDTAALPRIRKGILTPLDAQKNKQLDEQTINRLNSLYAKDYQIYSDLNIIWRGMRNLGK